MDSPIHPDLKPTPRPTPTSTPLPIHNNPLIQGSDIELAPRPFEERLPNPTPEAIELTTPTAAARRHFEEHLTNPPPEAIPHSTLELAKLPQRHPYLLPGQYPDTHLPKAWDSGGQHSSRPGSGYSHSHTTPTTGPESGPGQAQRYSYSDFSSPFDQSPLVPAAVPPLVGDRKGNGNGGGRRERICGVRRQWFWAGVAVGVFLVVVAVATGVGVGVGLSGGGGSSTTPSATSTRTLPSPTATAGPNANLISCPASNLTIYTASQRKFLLLCGRDYNSNLGTTADMYNTPTDTLAECIDLCAGQDGCVGAGWGHGTTGGARAICWLKSRLGEANDAPSWSFAVEDLED